MSLLRGGSSSSFARLIAGCCSELLLLLLERHQMVDRESMRYECFYIKKCRNQTANFAPCAIRVE